MDAIQIVILSAGKRLSPEIPTALIPIDTIPMIVRILNTLVESSINIDKIMIMVNEDDKNEIQMTCYRYMNTLRRYNVQFIIQTKQLLLDIIASKTYDSNTPVMILNVDMPLIESSTLVSFCNTMKKHTDVMFGTVCVHDPYGYGRIIREKKKPNRIIIVEQSELDKLPSTHLWQNIHEINTGIYLLKAGILDILLQNIETNITLPNVMASAKIVDFYPLFKDYEILNLNKMSDCYFATYILAQRRNEDIQRNIMTQVHKR